MELVRSSEDQVALTTSALEAARVVLRADYCAVAWEPSAGGEIDVISTHGISGSKASELAHEWVEAAHGRRPRSSLLHRVEPVVDPAGGSAARWSPTCAAAASDPARHAR